MSDSRAVYIAATRLTVQEAINQQEETDAEAERAFLLTMLNGLEGQAAALGNQRAAVIMQAEAIRQKLGLPKKEGRR